MKTKAYKLAAELGVREQLVLDWLKEHGYPNVRRADTIRADVAQAARKALSAQARRASFALAPMPLPAPQPRPAPPPPAPQAPASPAPPATALAPAPPAPPTPGVVPRAAPASPPPLVVAPVALASARESPPEAHPIQSGPLPPRRPSGSLRPVPQANRGAPSRGAPAPMATITRAVARSVPPAPLTSSFAELLAGHLPASDGAATAALPRSVSAVARPGTETGREGGHEVERPSERASERPTERASERATAREASRDEAGAARDERMELLARVARAESARDEAVRAREAADTLALAHAASAAEATSALAELTERHESLVRDQERVLLERTQLRQALHEREGQREALEQACADLQGEVGELRDSVERMERDRKDRQGMLEDLQQVMQREVAWRARALELERAHQLGTNLPALLQGFGLLDFKEQADVLRALLANRETATGLIRAIRQVDAGQIDKLVNQSVLRVCAHPVCNQVARLDEKVAVRVDNGRDCEVCGGIAARRWFARMVRECGLAGVRRLLVIGGGDRIHAQLRDLSQGQPVDLRLVAATEGPQVARVRGRVEGCDLLVLWSDWVVTADVSDPYSAAARAEGRPVVTVLGQTPDVVALARAVCNRLARNHVLVAS